MKAVILAGGKGTRMGSLAKDVPKPMIRVGGKPILEHQLTLLKQYGIQEVILLVNHLKDSIIEYFGDGSAFGIQVSYFEEPKPLGTVGGLKEIEAQLTEDFLVLYGDVMVNMDLQRLINFHQNKNSQCTLVLHPNDHPQDSDLVDMDEQDHITAFYPKPHPEGVYYRNLVNAALYVFSPDIFALLTKGEKADFGKNIFPKTVDKLRMFGYNTTEFLKDMGTPGRLDEVEHAYASGKIEAASYKYKQKAIFLDRDGVINPDNHFISTPDEMWLYDFTADAVRKINKSGYLALVATNQSVIARNMCTLDELSEIHKKMETLLGEQGAKLDKIYYCPHHPDKGFAEERPEYKIDCACRKPNPGMLLQGAQEFNVDLSQSYMIGDSERDIIAGKAAGCTTVGVATGKGLKKAKVLPDYFFQDLKEAIDFIVDDPFGPHLAKVREQLAQAGTAKPFVIAIGGKARSGKSTLASYLNQHLVADGKKVLRVSLDQWILPEDLRQATRNVFDRFQLPQICTDIKALLSGQDIVPPGYKQHHDRALVQHRYSIKNIDVVIIEGVVALSNPELRKLADLKVFVPIEDQTHLYRIYNLYRWKGKTDEEIDALYSSRSTDEYQLIDQDANHADVLISQL